MSTLRQENKSIYWAWKAMKQRCLNPKCNAYKNYGARGITVCDEWMNFEPFCEWALSNGYKPGLDLDRRDNSREYSPDNCRWVTRRENINNRRKTIYIEVDGVTKPRTEWETQLGLPHGTMKVWVETHGYEYTSARIKEIISCGYTPKDYGFSHRKAITHVETGKTYPSVREAAKAVGLSPGNISNSMRENRSTTKGKFVFVATAKQRQAWH